jgi:hypothetical protein
MECPGEDSQRKKKAKKSTHKKRNITVLFYRCRRRGPPTTLVSITQRARHNITDDSKGKAIPLQAWIVPQVSRRMRLPDFKTIGT